MMTYQVFSDELAEALRTSPMKRVYGEGLLRDIILHLEQLAAVTGTSKKQYIISDPDSCCDAIVPKLFEATNLADLFLQVRDWFLTKGKGGNYKSNSLSIKFDLYATVEVLKQLPKISAELVTVTEELFINTNRSCVMKDGKEHIFKEIPLYQTRLKVVGNVIVNRRTGVIGLCTKTDIPDLYRVTKLHPKYCALLSAPVTTPCSKDEDEEPEAYDILPSYSLSKLDMTAAEIFSLIPNLDDIILNMFGSFVVHEF